MTKEETFIEVINLLKEACSPARLKLLVELIGHDTIKKGLLEAPASTSLSFHHCFEGGLITHIHQVIKIGLSFNNKLINPQEFVTAAVLHDLHKVCDHEANPYYTTNILKNGKQSDKKPYKVSEEYGDFQKYVRRYNDPVLSYFTEQSAIRPSGHLSLMTVIHFSKALYDDLTEDEKFAIINHGGAYEVSSYSLAGKETALQIILHAADMLSSRYDTENW